MRGQQGAGRWEWEWEQVNRMSLGGHGGRTTQGLEAQVGTLAWLIRRRTPFQGINLEESWGQEKVTYGDGGN